MLRFIFWFSSIPSKAVFPSSSRTLRALFTESAEGKCARIQIILSISSIVLPGYNGTLFKRSSFKRTCFQRLFSLLALRAFKNSSSSAFLVRCCNRRMNEFHFINGSRSMDSRRMSLAQAKTFFVFFFVLLYFLSIEKNVAVCWTKSSSRSTSYWWSFLRK